MASEVPTMQPAITASPMPPGLGQKFERGGQPAGLVELDVDGLVELRDRGNIGGGVQAFVRANRMPRRAAPRLAKTPSLARGQRLLDQLHPSGLAGGEIDFERGLVPAFVGVGDQPGWGAPRRTAAMRSGSPAAAELHLEEWPVRRFPRRGFHCLGRIEA